jgi:predicted transcriptional regulator
MLTSASVIEKVASKLAPGKTPYFMKAHVFKAINTIETYGPIGRVKLSKTLGLGEGAIRTLIKHLEKEGLVKTSRAGIILTNSGEKLSSNLESRISKQIQIPQSSLTIGSFNIAICVKNAADLVKSGVEQRDAAIKVGAQGATTLIFNNGKLKMPLLNESIFKDFQSMCKLLISELAPNENDVIIIGSAKDKLTAELATIAATLETLEAS